MPKRKKRNFDLIYWDQIDLVERIEHLEDSLKKLNHIIEFRKASIPSSTLSLRVGNGVNTPSAKAEGFSQEQLSPKRGADYF